MLELSNRVTEKRINKNFIKNCWICEKWQPHKYLIDNDNFNGPVFLHLEFNN